MRLVYGKHSRLIEANSVAATSTELLKNAYQMSYEIHVYMNAMNYRLICLSLLIESFDKL
jgi:hypothetical protein